jgi:hypothetical protein
MSMRNTTARFAGVTFLVLQLWGGAGVLAQETPHQMKVGKRDDITLTSVTRLGSLTLRPGHYILQHRVSHGEHAMHFVKFIPYGGEPGHGRTYYPSGPMGISHTGEQMCKLEPLTATAEQTRVFFADENGGKRITKIEIKGENVAHIF